MLRRGLCLSVLLVACNEPAAPTAPKPSQPAPTSAATPVPSPDGTPITASMPALPAAAPIDLDAVLASAKKLPPRKYGKDVPAWAKTPIAVEHGKVHAVGVAPRGKMNLQLARDTAENRARAMIVKLKQGKPELDPEPFSGTLEGATLVNSFESKKDHNVYVLVEAPL
jgi:hypothetical protein